MNKKPFILSIFLVLLIHSLPVGNVANASAFPVHNINTGLDYSSIQGAINAAQTLDGHTILVDAGTYFEVVAVSKALTIKGESPETTVIFAPASYYPYNSPLVTLQKENSKMSGFTLNMNGSDRSGIAVRAGYCEVNYNILINGSYGITSGPAILGLNITQNRIRFINGAGILLSKVKLSTVEANSVTNCTYSPITWGIGIYLADGSDNNVIRGNVVSNCSNDGIGIWTPGGGTAANFKNVIAYNNVTRCFHGIESNYGGNHTVLFNSFANNSHGNARTYSSVNYWDNGVKGNYWGDYNGTDANGDGVGDIPYVIDSSNQDNFPLMKPMTLSQQLPTLAVSLSLNSTVVNSRKNVSAQVHVTKGALAIKDASIQLASDKGGTFTAQSGYTNSNGDFTATFTAPSVSAQTSVRIAATASKSGYNDGSDYEYVAVFPTGMLLPSLSISVLADPTTLRPYESSSITVRAIYDDSPIVDAIITITSNKGGDISYATGSTDSDGYFVTDYTAPEVQTQTTITITATGSKTGYLDGQGQTQIIVNPAQPQQPDLTPWIYIAGAAAVLIALGGGFAFVRRKRDHKKP